MLPKHLIRSSVYCSGCHSTKFFELSKEDLPPDDGSLHRKVLVHSGHVLLIEVDANGVIRNESVIKVLCNPLEKLIEEVSEKFYQVNEEWPSPLCIDVYTSNQKLHRLIETIISNVFRHAMGIGSTNRVNMTIKSLHDRTYLHGDGLMLNVGPYLTKKEHKEGGKSGIVLDISEAERNKLDIENIVKDYDWVALLVPRDKRQGYIHAFSSLLEALNKPFFIESLSNETLQHLFNFIFAVSTALFE